MAYDTGSKIVLGGEVILDLTGDDVVEADVASGKKFHKRDGSQGTGTNTNDVDSSGATAVAAEILSGKTAAAGGSMLTGTMPNRGAQTGAITDKDTPVMIQQGYHDGSGSVEIDASEKAKIIGNNIREGVTILGVLGTMSGSEGMSPQQKSVTPSMSAQTVLPDSGYNCLSQVNVAAIPVVITDNAAGGKTYTIG